MNKQEIVLKKLIFEAIDEFVEETNIRTKDGRKILKELFTFDTVNFMRDLGTQEIDAGTEIDTELWDWFLQTINESIQHNPEIWIKLFKQQKLKILCWKYFTKDDLLNLKELKSYLRKEIRKYFTALQNYTDLEGFRNKFSNLPSELLSNLIRYLLNASNQFKEEIKISKKGFKVRVKELEKERDKMIEKLDLIS